MRIKLSNLIKANALAAFVLELVVGQLHIQPLNSGNSHRHHQYPHVSSRNRSSAKSPNSATSDKLIVSLMDIFKLSRQDVKWFDTHFVLRSLELLYPKSLSQARQLKRCVLGVRFRQRSNRAAAIKLEFDQQVRARFNERSRTVLCNHPSRPVQGMPTERCIKYPQ